MNSLASPLVSQNHHTSCFIEPSRLHFIRSSPISEKHGRSRATLQTFDSSPRLRAHTSDKKYRILNNAQHKLVCRAAQESLRVTDDFYGVLGVSKDVNPPDLKRAYRKLALQFHPDVNSDPDAQDKFVQLSNAYEVLIDADQRALYDKYGLEGLSRASNKSRGAASAVWDTWDEFQPHVRKSRKMDARTASKVPNGEMSESGETLPQLGDVVEYPLSATVLVQQGNDRTKGVGLLVGRNMDRGDRARLPPEVLELVELEPLYQEDGAKEWKPDPLESVAFPSISQLRTLQTEYDKRTDSWTVLEELSEGCGSPFYEEEIIL